jgi:uncharacterized protein involved in outer membrane biogenesis
MTVQRKWLKMAMAAAAALLVAQVSVGALARTQLGRLYLRARLERAFGRPVEVRAFDAQVFPSLRLDAAGISVAEDPAFGNEYFLRAEKLTAGLRWLGLLRGHFEFGTLSLSRPSLILVRSGQGRWNLEDWLPLPKSGETSSARIYGPPTPPSAANRLQKIEFDDGRVNFKDGQDKQPFAFINVSGSVEQIATGRWQLQLAAQPWRSGVALQSAGTLRVRGDIAGTSSRLQPASFHVHWAAVSLADLLRLLRGQDYGVRGAFTLDAAAQSGGQPAGGHTNKIEIAAANTLPVPIATDAPFDWTFALDARASGLHRWDLTERADDPALDVKLAGRWNTASRTLDATELLLDAPHSNLRGSLHLASTAPALQIDSAGIQAADLLAWWRAFEPAVDDAVKIDQFFTGSASVRGWPPQLNQLAFSSAGGRLTIPGVAETIWIGPVQGGGDRDKLSMDPVRLQIGGARAPQPPARRRPAAPLRDAADLSASQDFVRRQGGLVIEGQVEKLATILRLAAALGRSINHGWELDGRAQGSFAWDWNQPPAARWNGKLALSKSRLAVAGLNQPLQIADAALIWDQGRRTALLGAVGGFGTTWTGAIKESKSTGDAENPRWIFDLHGERLDAAEIDRWVGPRARPNWLLRLLTSLSGGGSPNASSQETAVSFNNAVQATSANELLRRVDAEGNLSVNELIAEKLLLHEVQVTGSLRALRLELSDISAQWAGGKVRGTFSAKFAPRPLYDFTAQLDGIDLARLPVTPVVAEQWSGLANGSLRLTTAGVGREELLLNLEGQGKVALRDVELLGWDLSASVADGAARAGVSRWTAGNGTFALRNKKVALENLRLDNGKELTLVNGMVDFSRTADLSIKTADGDKRASRVSFSERTLRIVGPLSMPSVTVEGMLARTAPSGSTP